MVASIETHRAAAQQALAELRAWSGRLDSMAEEHTAAIEHWRALVDECNGQLQASQDEVARLQCELAECRQAVESHQQELAESKTEVAALAEDSANLQADLDAALKRSAHLADEAARQRRQAAVERIGLEAELKALRELLVQDTDAWDAPPEPARDAVPDPSTSPKARRKARKTDLVQPEDGDNCPATSDIVPVNPALDFSSANLADRNPETSESLRLP
ncbi:MAG: hypothetical protein AB7O62_13960 [Pirellulales bacterium]